MPYFPNPGERQLSSPWHQMPFERLPETIPQSVWPRSVCHIRPFIGLPIILLPQPAQLPLIPSSYLSSCTSSYLSSCTSGCQFPLLYLARRSLFKIITLGGSSFDQRSSDDLEEELVSNASKKQSRVLPLFFLRSPWYTTQII